LGRLGTRRGVRGRSSASRGEAGGGSGVDSAFGGLVSAVTAIGEEVVNASGARGRLGALGGGAVVLREALQGLVTLRG